MSILLNICTLASFVETNQWHSYRSQVFSFFGLVVLSNVDVRLAIFGLFNILSSFRRFSVDLVMEKGNYFVSICP